MTDFITFNHNGRADGPDWDDAVRGNLLEAADHVDRGQIKMAIRLVKEAERLLEERDDVTTEREERLARIAEVYPEAAEEARQAGKDDGLRIAWSPVNQAWFVLWKEQLLHIYNDRAEAEWYVADLRRRTSEAR